MFIEFGQVPGIELPSMKDSFCREPYSGRDRIIEYLKAGKKTYCAVGRARDRFSGEEIPGEWCGMTDGEYSWTSELIYYVEKYNLRLNSDFENKVISV